MSSDIGVLIVLFVVIFIVFRINWSIDASWNSVISLTDELNSPIDSPQSWVMQQWVPFKYRLIFYGLVKGTWSLLFDENDADGFVLVFRFWSAFFSYAVAVAFFFLLQQYDSGRGLAFLGVLFFLLSPPVFYAYVFPVHTREDPIAFLLIILQLSTLNKGKMFYFGLLNGISMFCRETLLIVPLCYFIVSSDRIRLRAIHVAVPILTALLIRFLPGFESYDPLHLSKQNWTCFHETSIGIFLVFGVLWLPGLLGLSHAWSRRFTLPHHIKFLVCSAPWVIGLILTTHLVLGRAREIRISFLLFPWIISLGLIWLRSKQSLLKQLIKEKCFRAYVMLVLINSVALFFHLNAHLAEYNDSLYTFAKDYWLKLIVTHIFLTLVFGFIIVREKWAGRHEKM